MPKSVVTTDRLMLPIAHFSFGARAGNLVYVGATAGTDATRRLAGSSAGLADAKAQAAQIFVNLELSLKLLGATPEDVLCVKTYITDWRDLPSYEAEYERYAGGHRPSHSIVGTQGFPLPQASVETELVAMLARQGAEAQHCCVAMPFDENRRLSKQDPLAQAKHALQNLAKQLDASGLGLTDVVMLSVTLSDIRHLGAFESAFRQVFRSPYPARSIQGASLADRDMLVQVESVAVPGGGHPIFGLGQLEALGAASPGMLAGDILYIGAQLGARPDGTFPKDVEDQVRAAWQRINALLVEAGLQPDDVIHTTNTLTDWRSYGAFNAAFGPFVSAPFPPRATILGDIVDPRALIQIETLAHTKGREATMIEVQHG